MVGGPERSAWTAPNRRTPRIFDDAFLRNISVTVKTNPSGCAFAQAPVQTETNGLPE